MDTPGHLSISLQLSFVSICLLFFFFFFWRHHIACGILVPQPGIEPAPPALEAQSLNHWTTREVPPSAYSQKQGLMKSSCICSLQATLPVSLERSWIIEFLGYSLHFNWYSQISLFSGHTNLNLQGIFHKRNHYAHKTQ